MNKCNEAPQMNKQHRVEFSNNEVFGVYSGFEREMSFM